MQRFHFVQEEITFINQQCLHEDLYVVLHIKVKQCKKKIGIGKSKEKNMFLSSG